jgi:hypothetical protein
VSGFSWQLDYRVTPKINQNQDCVETPHGISPVAWGSMEGQLERPATNVNLFPAIQKSLEFIAEVFISFIKTRREWLRLLFAPLLV